MEDLKVAPSLYLSFTRFLVLLTLSALLTSFSKVQFQLPDFYIGPKTVSHSDLREYHLPCLFEALTYAFGFRPQATVHVASEDCMKSDGRLIKLPNTRDEVTCYTYTSAEVRASVNPSGVVK